MDKSADKPSPIKNIAAGIAAISPEKIREMCENDPKIFVSCVKELSALIEAATEYLKVIGAGQGNAPDDLPMDIRTAVDREIGVTI